MVLIRLLLAGGVCFNGRENIAADEIKIYTFFINQRDQELSYLDSLSKILSTSLGAPTIRYHFSS